MIPGERLHLFKFMFFAYLVFFESSSQLVRGRSICCGDALNSYNGSNLLEQRASLSVVSRAQEAQTGRDPRLMAQVGLELFLCLSGYLVTGVFHVVTSQIFL